MDLCPRILLCALEQGPLVCTNIQIGGAVNERNLQRRHVGQKRYGPNKKLLGLLAKIKV